METKCISQQSVAGVLIVSEAMMLAHEMFHFCDKR